MNGANQIFFLVVSYSTIFVPALLLSRIALIALGRHRAHWFAIVPVHVLTVFAVLALQPWLLSLLLNTHRFSTFVSLTNGAVIDTQLLLMASDLIRPWIAASARQRRQWFAARHPYATGTALTAGSFLIGIALANWSAQVIDLTEEGLRYQIATALSHDSKTLAGALKQTFPDEFERLVDTYERSLRPLLSNRSRFQERFSRLPTQFTNDVSAFVRLRRDDVVRAPDRQLFAVAQAQPAMIEQLEALPLLCASFATGRTGAARQDPAGNQPASGEESEATARFIAADLFAAREGMNHPVQRNLNAVRRETALAFRARLEAMEEPSIVALSANPQALNMARAEDQCRVARAFSRAIASLPEKQAAELAAYQISHHH
jgi:hypothetical protein